LASQIPQKFIYTIDCNLANLYLPAIQQAGKLVNSKVYLGIGYGNV